MADAFSQNENDTIPGKDYVVQFSVSSFFERYNSVDAGFVKNINTSAIGLQLGYIYSVSGFYEESEDNWFKEVNGVKAFFQYRLYVGGENQYPAYSRTFFEIEPSFYYLNYNSERIVGYECSDAFGDCEYYRFFDNEINRFLPAVYLKMGKVYDFDPLVITLSGGIGVRHIFDVSDIPETPEPDKFFFTNGEVSNVASGTQFNIRLSVLIGYKF